MISPGTPYQTFHAAHTSILQVDAVKGVTVVKLANHLSPARIVSYRRFGIRKSIVVVIGWP